MLFDNFEGLRRQELVSRYLGPIKGEDTFLPLHCVRAYTNRATS